jgi:dipeptide/tripeptide permease
MGLAYNSGRIVSAAAPYIIGWLSESLGLRYALCATSAGFLIAAVVATALRLPTRAIIQSN